MQEAYGQAPITPCGFSQHLYRTPYLMAGSTSRIDAYHAFVDTPVVSSTDPVFVSGVGPYSWTGRFMNSPDQLFVDGGPYYHFQSQMKDVRDYPPLEYELSQGGAVVGAGTFNGSGSPAPLILPVAPGDSVDKVLREMRRRRIHIASVEEEGRAVDNVEASVGTDGLPAALRHLRTVTQQCIVVYDRRAEVVFASAP